MTGVVQLLGGEEKEAKIKHGREDSRGRGIGTIK